MDAKLIEKLDSRRYKYLLWQTVGFALFFPEVIFGGWRLEPHAARIAVALVAGVGAGLFVVATFKLYGNERRIKSDSELRAALNNELIMLYGYRSSMIALYVTIIAAAVLFLLSEYWLPEITVRFASLFIIYIGCVTLKISQLVYMRR